VIGAVLAFVRENFDESLRTKEEVSSVGLTVLGAVPAVRRWNVDTEGRAELKRPQSAAGEAFRSLRTSVQLLGVDRPVCIIQVTSPVAGEGKTSIVAGLGTLLAAAGQRVVLVDCDFRRPRLHEVFGLSNTTGMTSAFAGDATVLDVVQPVAGEKSLSVVCAGPTPNNPAEILSSPRMAELLFGLQGRFDVVLVDSAPVLPVADATLLATWVEVTVLVARAGSTTRRQLREAVDQLNRVDAKLAGVVLNLAGPDEATYGYYYTENGGSREGSRKERRAGRSDSRQR
jgi:capsular exopolysaccharide synthesis family protein